MSRPVVLCLGRVVVGKLSYHAYLRIEPSSMSALVRTREWQISNLILCTQYSVPPSTIFVSQLTNSQTHPTPTMQDGLPWIKTIPLLAPEAAPPSSFFWQSLYRIRLSEPESIPDVDTDEVAWCMLIRLRLDPPLSLMKTSTPSINMH